MSLPCYALQRLPSLQTSPDRVQPGHQLVARLAPHRNQRSCWSSNLADQAWGAAMRVGLSEHHVPRTHRIAVV